MDEMKILNEKYKLRHAEVERDRMEAEAKNSSVTSVMSVPKKNSDTSECYKLETEMSFKPKVKEREWDRGKSNFDRKNATSLKCQRPHPYWRGRSANKQMKKFGNRYREKNLQDRRINRNKDSHDNSSRFKEHGRTWPTRKMSETRYQGTCDYRNDSSSKQRSCVTYRPCNYKSTNSRKEKYHRSDCSLSQSLSDSEMEPTKKSRKYRNYWRRNRVRNEFQYKQIRIQNWINSIDSTCIVDEDMITPKLDEKDQDICWDKIEDPNSEQDVLYLYANSKLESEGEEDDLYPYQDSLKRNPPKFFSNEKPSRKTDYYRSYFQKDSNKQWKSRSHSRNQSSEYSRTYKALAKQSDTLRSAEKKHDSTIFTKEFSSQALTDKLKLNHSDCNSYQIEDEKKHSSNSYPYQYFSRGNPSKNTSTLFSNEKPSRKIDYYRSYFQKDSNKHWKSRSHSKNQSKYANIKVNQFEMGELGSVENDTVSISTSEFSSLNVKSSDRPSQNPMLQHNEESYKDLVLHVLSFDGNNNDCNLEHPNITHPLISDTTAGNLEFAEIQSKKIELIEISSDSDYQDPQSNNYNIEESVADICVVSKITETAMEQADENNPEILDPNCPVVEILLIEISSDSETQAMEMEEDEKEAMEMEGDGKEAMEMEGDGKEATEIEEDGKEATEIEEDGKEATKMELLIEMQQIVRKKAIMEKLKGTPDNILPEKEEDVTAATSKEVEKRHFWKS